MPFWQKNQKVVRFTPTSSRRQIAVSGPILVNPTDFESLEPVFFNEKQILPFCQFLTKLRHFEEKIAFNRHFCVKEPIFLQSAITLSKIAKMSIFFFSLKKTGSKLS